MRGDCDACGYKDTPVEEFGTFNPELTRRARYCEICSSSFISMVHSNPVRLHDPMFLYKSFALIANKILDAIQELKCGRRR